MKRVLYLTFYFEPDLCAGSFRNSPLVKELAKQGEENVEIEVITTFPNRYGSFNTDAEEKEVNDNLTIHRIQLPPHKSGMKDQIFSFKEYYSKAFQITKEKRYDLVVASSSRLFTAYLGYRIASKNKTPLYLDIRDIFYDTMEDVLQNPLMRKVSLPIIKWIEKKTFSYANHINLISEGFKPYFEQYGRANYSYYTNGIDYEFIENLTSLDVSESFPRRIVYAGNIGEGQGLEKIVPEAARLLGNDYHFIIIGDGGTKNRLIEKAKELHLTNIEFRNPMKRKELVKVYEQCDYTFIHLNDYKAFKTVLPSKIFELACFPQPIIVGVGGFANQFISQNISNTILFPPCNAESLVNQLKAFKYKRGKRIEFIEKHKREGINKAMAQSMIKYL